MCDYCTLNTYRLAHAATPRSTLPHPELLLYDAGRTFIPHGKGAYTEVCAACGENHSVPPIASGSQARDSITRLTMLWCVAMVRSQLPDTDSLAVLLPPNRSGDPKGPAAIPT